MLNNLRAEMVRNHISSVDIAKAIGRSDRTVRDKLRGKSLFSIQDAAVVRDALFPDVSLEYLFAREDQKLGS